MVFKSTSRAIYIFSSLLIGFSVIPSEAKAHLSLNYHDEHASQSQNTNNNSAFELLSTDSFILDETLPSQQLWSGIDLAEFIDITGIDDFVLPSEDTNYETLRIGARAELEEDSELLTFIETTETTQGEYSLGLVTQPPLAGTPLHIHHEEHEWFYITQGQYQFQVEDEFFIVNPGDLVFSPAGEMHNFLNIGDTRGEMYIVWEPGGVEDFFRDTSVDALINSPIPDEIQVAEAASQAGITLFLDPPTEVVPESSSILASLFVGGLVTFSILKRKN